MELAMDRGLVDGEEPSFRFHIDTNSFSADDFGLFVNALERTYANVGKHSAMIVEQQEYDDDSDDDSIYEKLRFGKATDSISGYEGSSSGGTSSRVSSVESLVHPDPPYNSMIHEQSIISTRPSLLDIFKYFDQEIDFEQESFTEESLEEEKSINVKFSPITPHGTSEVPSLKQVPIYRPRSANKNSLNDMNKKPSTAPINKPSNVPGKLSKKLLNIFESEIPSPNNRKVVLNSTPNPHPKPPRKAPIIRRNEIEQSEELRKKVDNSRAIEHGPTKSAMLAEATKVAPMAEPPVKVCTVKIVNATRKVDSVNLLGTDPKSSLGRDKCFVRNINDLFLHYRTKLEPTFDQQQVQQVLKQLEKPPTPDVLATPMEETPHFDPAKATRKKTPAETAQQIHFRLQNQTYRCQMRSLIDSQNFVHMSAANRNQLFHLDKIFNRSSLSLIHMVLSLIKENVIVEEDRVSIDLQTNDYDGFVKTMSAGSYVIDAMTTSTIRENCVSVEILAIDETIPGGSKPVKIVLSFVIETSDESRKRQATTGDVDRPAPAAEPVSDFQITVRMRFKPPENELQKSHETGTNLSEHQLRVQASLQRLNIPDWYKQYSGKDGNNPTLGSHLQGTPAPPGGILRKRNSDVGRWTGLSSKTTSLSSLGSHRSDRSPVMLSPSAHSHHGGQTTTTAGVTPGAGFSRWSTSHLNSNQTSPSVSTRGSFSRGGLNASVISGYSTASTTVGATATGNSAIRNSFRQPYLGWRSQEKLAQPRTPAERLASTLLSQQKAKEQSQQQHQHQQQQQQKVDPVVTPEIQSSIKEVTSAIVHYVNDQTNRHSRSRSTSPSQRCWLESSFVGTRPLDSPQTPMIDNNSTTGSGLAGQPGPGGSMMAGDHYRYNAGRMNGVVSSNHTLQIEPVQTRRRSEGDAGRRRNDSGGSGAISSGASSSKDAHSRRVSLDSCDTGHTKSHQGTAGGGGGAGSGGGDSLKCRYPKCDSTATIAEAKKSYKSCHNCSHLYCSRECRRAHWEKHRKACLHSRISALCRLVLSTCKDDADTLRHLSVLARRGYLAQGRGVVRILFRSPENADAFIKQGFQCLGEVSYVRWPDLLPSEMGPELYSELLKLSTEYKPDSKMLIYVAICVVSEAPGNATAPVKWERQLVSRCAKLKLCRSVIHEISNTPKERQVPKKDNVTDVLILSFNIMSKTTQKSRELVSLNIQNVLRQRGVILRKHYPEVFQRLSTFVEGSTDRFLPVTMHPRDSVSGRPFVCIIMPNYNDTDKLPISENNDDDRVVTMDVGTDQLIGITSTVMEDSESNQ
ncbi:uncharacterized protein LOC129747452 isoform X2 [Uranotaenia lowii]|uniref:uncharacterized protein LOC129747452 isoform X2 n=1 Tax=Uranotaenia lowii TaxID=190385 RepID=UPI0024796D75|nr:uncharacterized protein LOC129747452 isoform X2 [Uranotaenia lowii]